MYHEESSSMRVSMLSSHSVNGLVTSVTRHVVHSGLLYSTDLVQDNDTASPGAPIIVQMSTNLICELEDYLGWDHFRMKG